jgi:hypothetical protein
MKLKLNSSEYQALYSLLHQAVDGVQPANLPEKLLLSILDCVYGKFYNQGRNLKPKYVIKLTCHEAIAMLCYFGNSNLEPTSFEGNLIRNTCNKIRQQYA